MRAINLKTNHLTAPLGMDAGPLFLSWQCVDGVRQTAYEIELTANGETVWHSGKVQSAAVHADAPTVGGSRVRGCWRVRLWDENDTPGAWSEARFETGLAQCPGMMPSTPLPAPTGSASRRKKKPQARAQPSRTSPIVRHRTCAKPLLQPRVKRGCTLPPRGCMRYG